MVSAHSTVLSAKGLSKRYGDQLALDQLDLEVKAGEIVCLVGANGAGKSTTISLFLGLLEPSEGTVRVCGLDPVTQRRDAARKLAYLPENVALYPELTGFENLDHFTRLSGRRLERKPLLDILLQAGLPDKDAMRRTSQYSKGMRQKVGIAIALAKNASALVLDEPLSGLDPLAANDFTHQLKAQKYAGLAILMATHDLFRARQTADRIVIMKAGRILDTLRSDSLDASELEDIYMRHMTDDATQP